ncbi:MAG: uncharacterized protein KVP18_000145 [Porospora cf. gigantea A]|uniref:uncharacterized protein n=1 Tax=Porospora cf. gigantea A TaxID=2853593 RepID=UPI003559F202|nr:MAG: hypothetical protein KVP18_000145 [Porospora cf. gigantea A]
MPGERSALAIRGFHVCLLEPTDSFGFDQATRSTNNLQNDVTVVKNEVSRAWLDLDPRLVVAHSSLTQLLLRGGVSKYLEFRGIDSVCLLDDRCWPVPLSKAGVMSSPVLEGRQRRCFMRILKDVVSGVHAGAPSGNEVSTPFVSQREVVFTEPEPQLDFEVVVERHNADACIRNMLLHGVLFSAEPPPKRSMSDLFRSLSRYGQASPFLYTIHGTGDLPQGLVRLASVYGGQVRLQTAVLNSTPTADGIELQVRGMDGAEETLTARYLVSRAEPTGSPRRIATAWVAVRKPLLPGDGASLGVWMPSIKLQAASADLVQMVQLDHSTLMIDEGLWWIVLQTSASSDDCVTEDALLPPAFRKIESVLLQHYAPSDLAFLGYSLRQVPQEAAVTDYGSRIEYSCPRSALHLDSDIEVAADIVRTLLSNVKPSGATLSHRAGEPTQGLAWLLPDTATQNKAASVDEALGFVLLES